MKKNMMLLIVILGVLVTAPGCNETQTPSQTAPDTHVPQIETSAPETQDNCQENKATDFVYEVNEQDGITITKYIGDSTDVIIPDTIQGKPVTKIGGFAFVTDSQLCQITASEVHFVQMPSTITVIEGYAFKMCTTLTTVILSENLESIGPGAFQECKQLKHITIPSQVRTIADQAFESSGLESITFQDGIETISGYGAFACTNVTEIVLPSTLKELGNSTFAACPNLESVVLNHGLVDIGHKTFVNNPKLKEIVIPPTVECITEYDFSMCSGLEKIMFEGNAPSTFQYSDDISGIWEPYDVHFAIYYHEGAEGFTSPEWYGYSTYIW